MTEKIRRALGDRMFGRNKKSKSGVLTRDDIAKRLPDREDLVKRLETLTEELSGARDRLNEASWQMRRRSRRRGQRRLDAARDALEQARRAADRLPSRDDMVELTRKTGQRLRVGRRQEPERPWRRWLVWSLLSVAALGGAVAGLLRGMRGRGTSESAPGVERRPEEEGHAQGNAQHGVPSSAQGNAQPDRDADEFAADFPVGQPRR